MSEKTVIEIKGVKMEVDMRHAVRIDQLQVGDRVKVLVKEYSDHKVYPGVVIGFEPFKELPTIIIAYMKFSWSGVDLAFLYFNSDTKETEVVKAIDADQLDFDKKDILDKLQREINKKEAEIREIEEKRDYFLRQFRAYWEPVTTGEETTDA